MKIKELRKECLRLSHIGNDGNLQSTFSALDIIWTLYDKVMNITVDNYKSNDKDYFILSKGQSSLALYVVLAEKGFINKDELQTFCKFDSRFSMQCDRTKFNNEIEISAGSLGHGLPMAVGMAMALKIKKSKSKVYVLISDGELNYGTTWESLLLASTKKLDNLCIIIDNNSSIESMINIGYIEEKIERFGVYAFTIDGHANDQIIENCKLYFPPLPIAIICNTVRGYGSKTLMNDKSWFHRSPNTEELDILLKEVDNFEKTNV